MERPCFNASEISGLMGLNQWKPRSEVIQRVMSKMTQFKDKVKAPITDRELVLKAPAELKVGLKEAIIAATEANTDESLQQVIDEYKQTIVGKTDDKTFEALSSEIQKQRGVKLEAVAEDNFGGVKNRGQFVQYNCPEYRIIGFIDGLKGGKIVETKNRKKFWNEPPVYDIIQLRCYMRMMGNVDGILLETFPGISAPRTTDISWSNEEWDKINKCLLETCREIYQS